MNKDEFKGNWNILKGRVKQAWGELTDDEVDKIDGNYDELVGLVQKKTGQTREEAHKAVDAFFG
jgi:uncharacterized protein YjbJ (UPF0337 family)